MINKYSKLSNDRMEEHLSNYLIDSWSYSKVRAFSCNEKEFEMRYLYGMDFRYSASGVAGNAYHSALNLFFCNHAIGRHTDIVDMQEVAYLYIDEVPANRWKIQKTTPTVSECIAKATELSNRFIENFLSESNIYLSEIKEVISSETKIKSWVCVNGVHIPLPCNMILDLVIKTNEDKLVIIDHKSKSTFTDEKELAFSISKQAMTYVLGYEETTGQRVDEVWFIENKQSKNRDKSAQLSRYIAKMDADTRRLYEALLYEPLKRMIEAVSDPDYVYLINDNDSMSDKAEVYEFWAKTMLAEVEDFNIPDNKKPLIQERLRKIRDASIATISPNVLKDFRKHAEQFIPYDYTNKDMTNQEKIEHVLRSFNIMTKIQHTFEGYSSASYLMEVSAGIPLSAIQRYKLDIANALNVSSVRIHKDLFVYDGRSYVAIEAGKKSGAILSWDKSKLEEKNMIPLGVDNFQQTVYWDLSSHSTPHMLVCGATGSGKSVFLRSTLDYCLLAGVNDVYILDPKHEFKGYAGTSGVSVLNDIQDIEAQVALLVDEMENRVRNGLIRQSLVVFDEFADAFANARKAKDLKIYGTQHDGYYANGNPKLKRIVVGSEKSLEENIRLLLQKGRSCGFRIIAATQRASTKVITGDAKVNFPVQVCFRVPKDVDSMVVLDEPGAEALNGRGDALIKSPDYLNVIRFQAYYRE